MAEIFGPYGVSAGDPGDVDEDVFSKMFRQAARTGVVGAPGSSALQVYADSSGMNVFVRTGRGIVRGTYYENTAIKTIAIAANGTGSNRLDRIVVEVDPTGNVTAAKRVAGSTTPPTLTQTDVGIYQMTLAKITVPPSAATITLGNVTDERVFTNTNIIPCRVVADITDAQFGDIAREFTTGAWYSYDGTQWVVPPAAQLANTLFMENLGVAGHFRWEDPGGVPSYLWGSNDGTTHRVYPPSRLSVAAAVNATNAVNTTGAGTVGFTVLTGSGFNVGALGGGIIQASTGVRDRIIAGRTVLVAGDATLGSASSSRRYKKDIEPLAVDLRKLRKIEPATFCYNPQAEGVADDIDETPQAGFIAENVAENFPLGAAYDEQGRPDDINERALLAAAYLRIADLETRLDRLEKRSV